MTRDAALEILYAECKTATYAAVCETFHVTREGQVVQAIKTLGGPYIATQELAEYVREIEANDD